MAIFSEKDLFLYSDNKNNLITFIKKLYELKDNPSVYQTCSKELIEILQNNIIKDAIKFYYNSIFEPKITNKAPYEKNKIYYVGSYYSGESNYYINSWVKIISIMKEYNIKIAFTALVDENDDYFYNKPQLALKYDPEDLFLKNWEYGISFFLPHVNTTDLVAKYLDKDFVFATRKIVYASHNAETLYKVFNVNTKEELIEKAKKIQEEIKKLPSTTLIYASGKNCEDPESHKTEFHTPDYLTLWEYNSLKGLSEIPQKL